MILNTPDGPKEGKRVDYELEGPEPQFKIFIANGDTLLCRPIVGAVFSYTDNAGETCYQVANQFAMVKT